MKTILNCMQGTKTAPLPVAELSPRPGTRPLRSAIESAPSRQTLSSKPGARKPIRLLLADDHPVVRKGLSSCLAQAQHLVIVGEATDGQEALRKAKELLPDVVLMDLHMPVIDGAQATAAILAEFPEAVVLLLATFEGDEGIDRALHAGAKGCCLKDVEPEELLQHIRSLCAAPA